MVGHTLKAGNASNCSFESPSTRLTRTFEPWIAKVDILVEERSLEAFEIARNGLLTPSIRLQTRTKMKLKRKVCKWKNRSMKYLSLEMSH